jgi:FAD/FMN-containing dehydrogenase
VIKSGGNSSWSTIGSKGWIIDLSLLQTITLNATDKVATIQSGVLTKKLNVALSEINFYLPTPTGGSVAFIPFMLGGGSSPLSGMYGLAIDSLLSARVVTASGDIVVASEDENPDLLWALKGAGQFFGIVTEVRMRMYDIEDPITTTILFFLPQQIDMVAQVLEKMVNGELSAQSSGMAAILAPPGKTDVRHIHHIGRIG